jgi:small multidrug resistance pump
MKYLRPSIFTCLLIVRPVELLKSPYAKWIVLAVGILFEVLGTISMKYAEGFTRLVPSILVFFFYGISLAVLVFVLEEMEVGIAYAIWASAGTALIAIIGILFYNEQVSAMKLASIALIIIGIIGLEVSSD